MFTGIVQGLATIADIIRAPGLNTLVVRFPKARVEGVSIGASVAINGTCMTVTRQDGDLLYFDAMQETLRLTTLGDLREGRSEEHTSELQSRPHLVCRLL